jgi:hypothetical protein
LTGRGGITGIEPDFLLVITGFCPFYNSRFVWSGIKNILLNNAFGVRKCVVRTKEKIMAIRQEEFSGFSMVSEKELENINGGKGGSTVYCSTSPYTSYQTYWGNPVNDLVMNKIQNTYYQINNAVGYTVLNTAPVVASTIISFGTTFISGIGGVVTGLLTNTGGSSGSLY